MRVFFFLLVLANLLVFVWGQGYVGGQAEGREPQRLREQIQPEKMKVAVIAAATAATAPAALPPQACRRIDGLAAKEAETVQKVLQDAGLAVEAKPARETQSFWVNIPALPNKLAADKKVSELRQLGVADFQVMQTDAAVGPTISFGVFGSEAAANDVLAALNKKGVRSARIEAKTKPPGPPQLEVRGAADALAKRLAELLPAAATAADCQ